jgi:aryl-alcohol dehydrogenase-like predicted oxidoreductase
MGMSRAYGPADEAESIATIHLAIDQGVTLFDTAETYGPYVNEELLGRALSQRRDGVVIASKFIRYSLVYISPPSSSATRVGLAMTFSPLIEPR